MSNSTRVKALMDWALMDWALLDLAFMDFMAFEVMKTAGEFGVLVRD
jgi:hypothetical protein